MWLDILGPLDETYVLHSSFSSCGFILVINTSHILVRLYYTGNILSLISMQYQQVINFVIALCQLRIQYMYLIQIISLHHCFVLLCCYSVVLYFSCLVTFKQLHILCATSSPDVGLDSQSPAHAKINSDLQLNIISGVLILRG